ncbi:DUF7146 domain-containing protein [Paracoccus rhizosphaerae]|uniref:DUF7146 domain-containing protein n=1 Tax=Paracoccus rhizosphaerae TaxID=1133347 RepID=A0ABV6CR68_9RHOB|nr:hypothetical protein [Paracoccus rhizosphaerae]
MSDAQSLTAALRGKWHRIYGLACCPAHSDRRPSLTIGDGHDGRLLLSCKAGCDFLDVLSALRGLGLMEGSGSYTPPSAADVARREAEARAEAERVERKALATWNEALPIGGTIAERYLRGRGITCPLPSTLRFHPECWHPTAKRYPAMVALIEGLPRTAIHRTYLRADGSGKADADPAKAMQGASMGGAVHLVQADGPLVVAEGIETALSLASGLLRGVASIGRHYPHRALPAFAFPSVRNA